MPYAPADGIGGASRIPQAEPAEALAALAAVDDMFTPWSETGRWRDKGT
ncbi:hypothetical protein OG609_29010 [Streptomyces sp. NBC_01224]|nr:hypothetical protein OG609_29010 [Streptomyces sp. NBC_01224]